VIRGDRSLIQLDQLAPTSAMSIEHLDDLRAQADYARQRYQLYKAKAYGLRPTSPVRMRELERTAEMAAARLLAAEAQLDRDDSAGG
jgi:hypothetical protein